MRSPVFSSIEPLEARIAPATLVFTSAANSNEKVTITTNHGSMAQLTHAVTSSAVGTTFTGDHFQFALDLTGQNQVSPGRM